MVHQQHDALTEYVQHSNKGQALVYFAKRYVDDSHDPQKQRLMKQTIRNI